jgi:hypothetical protein
VSRRRRRGHDGAHVGAIHAIHLELLLLLLLLLMVERLLLELLLLLLLLEVMLLEIVLLKLLLLEGLLLKLLLLLLQLLLLLLLLMPRLNLRLGLSLCLSLSLSLCLCLLLLLLVLMLENGIQVERSRKAHVARGLFLVEVVSEDLRLWGSGCHCWGSLGFAKMDKVPRQLMAALLYIGPCVWFLRSGESGAWGGIFDSRSDVLCAGGNGEYRFPMALANVIFLFFSLFLLFALLLAGEKGCGAKRKGLPAGLQVIQTRVQQYLRVFGRGLYVHTDLCGGDA